MGPRRFARRELAGVLVRAGIDLHPSPGRAYRRRPARRRARRRCGGPTRWVVTEATAGPAGEGYAEMHRRTPRLGGELRAPDVVRLTLAAGANIISRTVAGTGSRQTSTPFSFPRCTGRRSTGYRCGRTAQLEPGCSSRRGPGTPRHCSRTSEPESHQEGESGGVRIRPTLPDACAHQATKLRHCRWSRGPRAALPLAASLLQRVHQREAERGSTARQPHGERWAPQRWTWPQPRPRSAQDSRQHLISSLFGVALTHLRARCKPTTSPLCAHRHRAQVCRGTDRRVAPHFRLASPDGAAARLDPGIICA